MVRSRSGSQSHRTVLVRIFARNPAHSDGLGGEQAMGGLLQPGVTVGGVGDAMVKNC